jgi:ATP synthase protein I
MPFTRHIPNRKPQPKMSAGFDVLVQAEKMIQIAILLPSAAFIGWLAGAWADSQFHQSWISIAGIVLGGVSGLYYVIKLVMKTGNEPNGDVIEDEKGKGKPGPKS